MNSETFSCERDFSHREGRYLDLALVWALWAVVALFLLVAFKSGVAWAGSAPLPGDDASSKMESAGTLIRLIDSVLFKWVSKILAGLCIFSAGWNLKEMRFGPASISIVAAVLFGTAPTWVKNIFTMGSADSVLTQVVPEQRRTLARSDSDEINIRLCRYGRSRYQWGADSDA